MAENIISELNRLVSSRTGGVNLDPNAIVRINVDAAEQINLYGLTFGYQFLADIDVPKFLYGRVMILLDPTFGLVNIGVLGPVQPAAPDGFGTVVGQYFNSANDGLSAHIRFERPVPITGDHTLVVIATRPIANAALTADVIVSLTVWGESQPLQDYGTFSGYKFR